MSMRVSVSAINSEIVQTFLVIVLVLNSEKEKYESPRFAAKNHYIKLVFIGFLPFSRQAVLNVETQLIFRTYMQVS